MVTRISPCPDPVVIETVGALGTFDATNVLTFEHQRRFVSVAVSRSMMRTYWVWPLLACPEEVHDQLEPEPVIAATETPVGSSAGGGEPR